MAASAAPTDTLDIDGSTLRWFSPPDDPNVEYGFCSQCGSSLFFRVLDDPSSTSICAGSIDGPSGLHTAVVWFAGAAGDHIRLDPTILSFDGQPER